MEELLKTGGFFPLSASAERESLVLQHPQEVHRRNAGHMCCLLYSKETTRLPHAASTRAPIGDRVDKILILPGARTFGDRERLPVGLFRKCGRPHVGYPNLDRPQTLLAQPLPMRSNLMPRRLGWSSCSHVHLNDRLHVTYHNGGLAAFLGGKNQTLVTAGVVGPWRETTLCIISEPTASA